MAARDSARQMTEPNTGAEIEQNDIQSDNSRRNSFVGDGLDPETARVPAKGRRQLESYPSAPLNREKYVSKFDGTDDVTNPQNWPPLKKLRTSAIGAYSCWCATFASALWSPATKAVGRHFNVSPETGILTTSLFLLGFAFGPATWGPLSELCGRRLPISLSMFGFVVFSAGTAAANDLQTVIICRFFTGVMGSCPLVVVPGILSDIYNHEHRGIAIAVYIFCLIMGPVLAPVIGGFTVISDLGWRFEGYWCLFLGALALVLSILFLPETYVPIILVGKAREARKRTNNWAIYAPHENIEVDLKQLVVKYLARPLVMLVTEPVLFVVSFYMSFIYALLYLFFEAYPLVFEGVYGFNAGIAGLPFFALGIGVLGSCLMSVLIAPSYNRKLAANHHVAVPEWRLPQVILGGVVFTVGLFWFGWTGRRASMHWIVPTLSGILTGFGIVSIFMPLMNFILDMYPTFAASAISAATIMRSAVAAAFPLFAAYMYDGLGIGLASTVLGCVAAALVPVPVTLYFYGPKLRQRSKLVLNQKA